MFDQISQISGQNFEIRGVAHEGGGSISLFYPDPGNEVAGGLAALSSNWAVPSKVFKGCASLGPCIVSVEDVKSPLELHLELKQYRGANQIGESALITKFKRTPEDIIASTVAHDASPKLVIQYTGGFTVAKNGDDVVLLQKGDVVRITLEGVGFVENEVEVV